MSEQAFLSYRDLDPPGYHTGILGALTNWLGAIVSVFLVVGLVFWGYQITMRDVTEVPVVRALEGPLRVQPDDPGGEIAAHQGLAVNTVQSDGTVGTPADQVVLAPPPIILSDEDLALADLRPEPMNLTDVSANTSAIDEQAAIEAAVLEAVSEGAAKEEINALAHLPGVKSSPRPKARVDVASLDVAGLTAASVDVDVDPSTVLTGTRMVQLGAFDDRTAAIAEWDIIIDRHGDLIGPRKRLIQEAESGGRSFYRLRMVGFESLSDSRRLCSALLARGTPCIPVTAR